VRGHYKHSTADGKARIAELVDARGFTSSVRDFAAECSDTPLNESTVHIFSEKSLGK